MTETNTRAAVPSDLHARIAEALAADPKLEGMFSDDITDYFGPANAVLAVVLPELKQPTAEAERLRQELGTIRGELADFVQEAVPSHVSTLQAVRWLIAEHDEQVKHNEEIGQENRALCDERDMLAWLHAEAVWQAGLLRQQRDNGMLRHEDTFGDLVDMVKNCTGHPDSGHASHFDQLQELRADKAIRQGALNDVLGRDRSQDSPTDYYSAVEDVAELKRALVLAEERIAKTRQALRLDDKWSVQHGALAVRSERDRLKEALEKQQALLAAFVGACSCTPTMVAVHESGSYCGDAQHEELVERVLKAMQGDNFVSIADARRIDDVEVEAAEAVAADIQSWAATPLPRMNFAEYFTNGGKYCTPCGVLVPLDHEHDQATSGQSGAPKRSPWADYVHAKWEGVASAADWKDAYESKLADFARETQRVSRMLALCDKDAIPREVAGEAMLGYMAAQDRIRGAAQLPEVSASPREEGDGRASGS